jgi:hypothetical protein
MVTPARLASSFLLVVGCIAVVFASAPVALSVTTPAAPGRAQEGRRSVWDGVYTADQAVRGEAGYVRECAACHKRDLYGDEYAPALIRREFYKQWGGRSVGELHRATQSTMPQDAPASLPVQVYVDIVSYVLKMNQMPAGQAELPTEQAMLDRIAIHEKPAP